MRVTDYRKNDVVRALERARHWLLMNRNPDGGWVFKAGQAFEYGSERATGRAPGGPKVDHHDGLKGLLKDILIKRLGSCVDDPA